MDSINYRLTKTGPEAKKALKKGLDLVADIIKSTLGPFGRNVMIEELHGKWPHITNDGATIARETVLKDEFENLGAQSIINVATATNGEVGDGTTTSVVLAQSIIKEAFKSGIEDNSWGLVNVIEMRRKIQESCKKIVEKLKKMAKPVKTKEDLERVAVVSVENEELGKMIAEMRWQLGKDAYVSVEKSVKMGVENEVMTGMKIPAEYLSERFATNSRREAVYLDVPILVTNKEIESPEELAPLVTMLSGHGKKGFVLIAPKFSASTKETIVFNHTEGRYDILAIKAAPLTTEWFKDVAIYTNSAFIDKDQNMKFEDVMMKDFGGCEKIVADRDKTIIINGKGKDLVENRIKELKDQIEIEEVETLKNNLKQRVSSLSGAIGRITVGAKTDIEAVYLKDKIDDADFASKAALEEGIVPGGGLALKEISDGLEETDVLKKPLLTPYQQIQDNAGGNLKIGEEIIDPVKVVRIALENACSFAGIFITLDAAMPWKKHKFDEALRNAIAGE